MRIKAFLAISAVAVLCAGAASANPGDAVRDVVGGTGHLAAQTGRAGIHEGERVGHRIAQTGRATGHAVAKRVRRIGRHGHRRGHRAHS